MTKVEKLLERFKKKPKDFSFEELKRFLRFFDYEEKQGAGSRVMFINGKTGHKIKIHKPHPGNIVKRYQLDVIENELKSKGRL